MKFDIAIIGGGPSGSTVGSLLKRQRPDLDIVILESAKFPRDHVGESLLPAACAVLDEVGVWDKVEAAEFPIKLGGLYRWGVTDEIYPLTFLREELFEDAPRPGKYEGQRTLTAFQVDRSIFDKILLDHAASLGCNVFQESTVFGVDCEGGRIRSLNVASKVLPDAHIEADYYVDASGNRSILRKALGIEVEAPTSLRNIAIYEYWQNADWGTRHGEHGTHIHVMSIDWGWLWFIAMGKTRTSVGLVTSAEYYKKSGLSKEDLYLAAIRAQPLISKLLEPAERENQLKAEGDWSYIANSLVGENWFLAGDSAGFADPILSAGLTLAMTGARKVAYSLNELKGGSLDPAWVKSEYDRVQKGNIREHIRFADYWYSVNAKFTDLKDYCAEIARDAGLNLEADEAFRWLGNGGFSGDAGGYQSPTAATFMLSTVKSMLNTFGGVKTSWNILRLKKIRLNLTDAVLETSATYYQGKIVPQQSYRRGDNRLFLHGFYKRAYVMLLQKTSTAEILDGMLEFFLKRSSESEGTVRRVILEVLESMLLGGWIEEVSESPLPKG